MEVARECLAEIGVKEDVVVDNTANSDDVSRVRLAVGSLTALLRVLDAI